MLLNNRNKSFWIMLTRKLSITKQLSRRKFKIQKMPLKASVTKMLTEKDKKSEITWYKIYQINLSIPMNLDSSMIDMDQYLQEMIPKMMKPPKQWNKEELKSMSRKYCSLEKHLCLF